MIAEKGGRGGAQPPYPLESTSDINNLSKNLSSIAKLFVDDASFSVVHDISPSSLQLNDDLIKISNWAYQWKISFNPEVTKQAQEVVFSQLISVTPL